MQYESFRDVTVKKNEASDWFSEFKSGVLYLYPFSMHVVTFTFHYQLMHLLIKTLSQFTFKTTHVKNVCDVYLKLILKPQHVSVSPPTIIRGQFPYLAQLPRVSLPARQADT